MIRYEWTRPGSGGSKVPHLGLRLHEEQHISRGVGSAHIHNTHTHTLFFLRSLSFFLASVISLTRSHSLALSLSASLLFSHLFVSCLSPFPIPVCLAHCPSLPPPFSPTSLRTPDGRKLSATCDSEFRLRFRFKSTHSGNERLFSVCRSLSVFVLSQ